MKGITLMFLGDLREKQSGNEPTSSVSEKLQAICKKITKLRGNSVGQVKRESKWDPGRREREIR